MHFNKVLCQLVPLFVCVAGQFAIPPNLNQNVTVENRTDLMADVVEDNSAYNCSGRKLLDTQPLYTTHASIRLCCPPGMNYHLMSGQKSRECVRIPNFRMQINPIEAIFYEGCVYDNESSDIQLATTVAMVQCKRAFVYEQTDEDSLYIIQDGSLMIVTATENTTSLMLHTKYCLFASSDDHDVTAMAALSCDEIDQLDRIVQAETFFYAIGIFVSVPCLLVTAFLYFAVEELRTVHGLSLAMHCVCLAIAFFIVGILNIRRTETVVYADYVIEYFMLACYLWMLMMVIDIYLQVCVHLPANQRTQTQRKSSTRQFLLIYGIISMSVPFVIVCIAYGVQDAGGTSIFLKDQTIQRTIDTQWTFVFAIILCILCSIALFTCILIGFVRFKTNEQNLKQQIVNLQMRDAKRLAKGTLFLCVVMTINFLIDVVPMLLNISTTQSLMMFDILYSLQGVLIFIIFVLMPHKLRIIKEEWKNRGSISLPDLEMSEMQRLHGART